MANTVTGIFQTLVLPGLSMLKQPTALRNSMLSKVYIQNQPLAGTVGQTVNVNIPTVAENDVIDIGNGPVQITDQDHTSVQLIVNNNKSKALRIPDFDDIRSAENLVQFYMQPAIESLSRKINRSICNLVTSTNFNSYTSITGGTKVHTRLNISNAWSNLRGTGAPDEVENQFLVVGHVPYANMIGDSTQNFLQQYVVGDEAATAAQQRAVFMPQFNATVDYDPMMPQPSAATTYAGLYFHRAAFALIPIAPPIGDKPNVKETYYQVPGSGLNYRVQLWYDPREQAWILHIHAVYALAVVRPSFGSYLVTA
jgi:hypothetical protein